MEVPINRSGLDKAQFMQKLVFISRTELVNSSVYVEAVVNKSDLVQASVYIEVSFNYLIPVDS